MPKRRASVSDSEKLENKKRKLLQKLDQLNRRERRTTYENRSTSEYSSDSATSSEEISKDRPTYIEPEIIIRNPEGEVLEVVPGLQLGKEPEVNVEILQLLGDVPSGKEPVLGREVHAALADRWTKYLALGIEKSEKEELEKRYLIPKNIAGLRAPLLNPELEALLMEPNKKEDKYVSTIQNHVGIALAAMGSAIDKILTSETGASDAPIIDIKSQLLPGIVDAGKILCDAFHMMSTNRKYHVEAHVNPTVKKLIKESHPDEYLCGKNFADKFKEVKAHWRTGKEMKNNYSTSKYQPSTSYYASVANKSHKMPAPRTVPSSLNYQPTYHRGRMKNDLPQRKERQHVKGKQYKKTYRKNSYPN